MTQSTDSVRRTNSSGNVFRAVHAIGKLSITCLIGVLIVMNISPWINAATQLVGNLPALVGLFRFLYGIPLLGWPIKGLVENLAVIAGFILWATVQSIQILPTLIERPQVLHPLISAWDGVGFKEKGDQSKMDALKRRFNDSLVQIIDNLRFYRALAYIVEALVCLWTFPPYVGGWQKLIEDYPVLDWDYVSFANIIMAIITMFGFEMLFRIALNLWGLTSVVKFGNDHKNRTQNPPREQSTTR